MRSFRHIWRRFQTSNKHRFRHQICCSCHGKRLSRVWTAVRAADPDGRANISPCAGRPNQQRSSSISHNSILIGTSLTMPGVPSWERCSETMLAGGASWWLELISRRPPPELHGSDLISLERTEKSMTDFTACTDGLESCDRQNGPCELCRRSLGKRAV